MKRKILGIGLICTIACIGVTVNAKSADVTIDYTANPVSLTKYQCTEQTHSAFRTSTYSSSTGKVSVKFTLHDGNSYSDSQIDYHNHTFSNGSLGDEWNWDAKSNSVATIAGKNLTSGSTISGRIYINNGLAS